MLFAKHIDILAFIADHPGVVALDVVAYFRSENKKHAVRRLKKCGYLEIGKGHTYSVKKEYIDIVKAVYGMKQKESETMKKKNKEGRAKP